MLKVSSANVTHLAVTALATQIGVVAHRYFVSLFFVLAYCPHLIKLLLAVLFSVVAVSPQTVTTLFAPTVETTLLHDVVKAREHNTFPENDKLTKGGRKSWNHFINNSLPFLWLSLIHI